MCKFYMFNVMAYVQHAHRNFIRLAILANMHLIAQNTCACIMRPTFTTVTLNPVFSITIGKGLETALRVFDVVSNHSKK